MWLALGLVIVAAGVGGFVAPRDDRPDTEELVSLAELEGSEPTMRCLEGVSGECRSAGSIEELFRSPELERRRWRSRPRTSDDLLVSVEVSGEVLGDADARIRRGDGRLQVGLTSAEIEGLWSRLERLRERLEDGSLGTF